MIQAWNINRFVIKCIRFPNSSTLLLTHCLFPEAEFSCPQNTISCLFDVSWTDFCLEGKQLKLDCQPVWELNWKKCQEWDQGDVRHPLLDSRQDLRETFIPKSKWRVWNLRILPVAKPKRQEIQRTLFLFVRQIYLKTLFVYTFPKEIPESGDRKWFWYKIRCVRQERGNRWEFMYISLYISLTTSLLPKTKVDGIQTFCFCVAVDKKELGWQRLKVLPCSSFSFHWKEQRGHESNVWQESDSVWMDFHAVIS